MILSIKATTGICVMKVFRLPWHNIYCHIGQRKAHAETFRETPNCSEFLLYCLVPKLTSCCQETAPAAEEKHSANVLQMEKVSPEEFLLPNREPQTVCIQTEFTKQIMILSQLCAPTLHNPVLIAAMPDFAWAAQGAHQTHRSDSSPRQSHQGFCVGSGRSV